MSHLILSHLSHNNNKPEIVDALFRQYAGKTNITIASRHNESEVFTVDPKEVGMKLVPQKRAVKSQQLSLF